MRAPQLAVSNDWADVCEREVDYVYWTLRRFGANAVDAEDLCQEVFLAMWRRRDTYDPTRPVRAWIAGISFRAFSEHRRRTRREVPGELVELADDRPGPDDRMATAQARAMVLAALGRMPEKQRTVLVMHELDGSSMRDIAEALSVPLFTLYSRLKSARNRFAKEVRRHQLSPTRAADPRDLLAAERDVSPAPPPVRRRLLARLRGFAPFDHRPRPAPAPRARWPLAVAAAALVGAGALMGVAIRHIRATSASAAPAPGPVPIGYWKFDEGRGSRVVRDVSGGTDCTLARIDPQQAWRAGAAGTGLALLDNGWVECPAPKALASITTELTITAWITRGTVQPGYHAVVARQLGLGREDQFMFGFAGDELAFTSHVWRGRKVTHPLPPNLGEWFHVAVTRSRDGTVILYVDGAELGRGQTSRGRLEGGSNPLLVGGAQNGPARDRTQAHFDGAVDELRIYDRALAAADIAAIARARGSVVSSLR